MKKENLPTLTSLRPFSVSSSSSFQLLPVSTPRAVARGSSWGCHRGGGPRHPCPWCSPFPPRKQLLAAAGVAARSGRGGVAVVVPPLFCPSFVPCSSAHHCSRPLAPAFHPASSRSQRQRWVLGSLSCPRRSSYVLSSPSLPTLR
jgi:hypothetical protein